MLSFCIYEDPDIEYVPVGPDEGGPEKPFYVPIEPYIDHETHSLVIPTPDRCGPDCYVAPVQEIGPRPKAYYGIGDEVYDPKTNSYVRP